MKTALCTLLSIYAIILLVRVLSSWFPRPYHGPLRIAFDLLYDVTEPLMRPLRKIIPPMRMGMVGLDLSPIILFIVIGILQRAICR